jgi:serine/threonine-protein kinase HipA
MRKAKVNMHGLPAGTLEEIIFGKQYRFIYDEKYNGEPVSLTMPVEKKEFEFNTFPPFFDGLLPEGIMLEGLLRQKKIDKNDYFSQLVAVGSDLVGAVTIKEEIV